MRFNKFNKNLLQVIGGAFGSQLVLLLASPILTRLYSPEVFGTYSLFIAVASLLHVVASGRYDVTIMLPKKNEQAINAVALSCIVNLNFCLLCFVGMLFFKYFLVSLLGNQSIIPWLYWIPLATFFMGCFQVVTYFATRQELYGEISVVRVSRSLLSVCIQVVVGILEPGAGGLIGGNVVASAFANIRLLQRCGYKKCLAKVSKAKMKSHALEYLHFPKYTILPSLLDIFSMRALIFFVNKGYSAQILGQIGLAITVLSLPVILISSSIGQIFFKKISDIANHSPENLISEITKTTKILLLLSLCAFTPLFFLGHDLCILVFGERWGLAGTYAEILSISLFFQFAVSPLSPVLSVTNYIKLGSFWKILYFLSTVSTLYFSLSYGVEILLWSYVIKDFVMYGIYYGLIMLAGKRYCWQHCQQLNRSTKNQS